MASDKVKSVITQLQLTDAAFFLQAYGKSFRWERRLTHSFDGGNHEGQH